MAKAKVKAKAKYEGSAADMARDKREAKKRGISLKAWEKSSADARMDAAAQRARFAMTLKGLSKKKSKKS